ncbi:hypothetical protein BLGI_722 [Brevibacillus laterosporus GI-9]|nr:hypothetical protein BLGI_722 [Brevibacillus laterosporus GI-9]
MVSVGISMNRGSSVIRENYDLIIGIKLAAPKSFFFFK